MILSKRCFHVKTFYPYIHLLKWYGPGWDYVIFVSGELTAITKLCTLTFCFHTFSGSLCNAASDTGRNGNICIFPYKRL